MDFVTCAYPRFMTGFEWWELLVNEGVMSSDDAWDIFEYSMEETFSSREALEKIVSYEGGLSSAYEVTRLVSVVYSVKFV